jgi:hypothetical protein
MDIRPSVRRVVACAVLLGSLAAGAPALAQAWAFGVMSDTQWTGKDDGKNPNAVAVAIVEQINQEFIRRGVTFVIQVGDLVNDGSVAGYDTRANYAQALYDAGIGFFPLRGNHDAAMYSAVEFQHVFPQTQNGRQNMTPADARVSTTDFGPPPANTRAPFTVGSDFSSPTTVTTTVGLRGLSYSFVYRNARFVMLDQFTRTDGSGYGSANYHNVNITEQQAWIDRVLAATPGGGHAFVLGHKNLIGETHSDTLLGTTPAANEAARNAFIGSLARHGVRLYVSGHDHVYQRSVIMSPDGTASVQQIIGASDSSKFYVPAVPAPDTKYDVPPRETPIVQELNRIGYYIYTVDGPRVTVEYFSAPVEVRLESGEYVLAGSTPKLAFVKRDTFGYSLNGKQFLVPQGGSYGVVRQTYGGTTAGILGGVNSSTEVDGAGRRSTKAVDTGWTDGAGVNGLASNILTLGGMARALGTSETDVYALSLTYAPATVSADQLRSGTFGLATRRADGTWVNAVDGNTEGTKKFVAGPWDPGCALGTYGVDPATHTAWAVINYNADFAVARGLK